jgi:hypothetical protein
MRIVDKIQFALGIFGIIVGVGRTIASIILQRYANIVTVMFPVGFSIMSLCGSIETRKQRQEKEERIKAQARLFGVKFDD